MTIIRRTAYCFGPIYTLFDLDLIGIEPETLIVHVDPSARAEGYEEFDGRTLTCDGAQPNKEALDIRWRAYQGKLTTMPVETETAEQAQQS